MEEENFHVIEQGNAEAALEYLAHHTFDCILVDVMMPGMNGYQFCKQVRASWDIPILMITAKGEQQDNVGATRISLTILIYRDLSRTKMKSQCVLQRI